MSSTLEKPTLRVDWCSYQAAKYAVEHWHYSHAMPTPPLVSVGVWESGVFIGAVIFGRGANKNIGRPYGLLPTEVAELVRVALNAHSAPVSQVVAVAVKMLARQSPGLRLVVSFADPNHGHVGAIYQAGNWVFVGDSGESYSFKDARGRVWHPRQVSKTGMKPQYGTMRAVPKTSDCTMVLQKGKYRYVMPLDRAMRRQVEAMRQPYPKRAADGETGSGPNPSRRCETDPAAPIDDPYPEYAGYEKAY